jgi:uncharacterized protein (DUF885 family)
MICASLITLGTGAVLRAQDQREAADGQAPSRPDDRPRGAHAAAIAEEWDRFVHGFIEDCFEANPPFAVWVGCHEFDGRLPDWSQAGLGRQASQLRTRRERALSFDAAALDERQRFERECIIWWTERDLFWLTKSNWPNKNPDYYAWWLFPTVYLASDYAPLEQRMRAYISYARAIPTAASQIRENLHTPMPRTIIEYGRIVFGGLASHYENDVPPVFASVPDTKLQEEFIAANKGAIAAMKELDSWLESQTERATDGFAMGPGLFLEMLRVTERLDISLDRLRELGEADLQRNLSALEETCAVLAPEKTVAECVAQVLAQKPAEGPVEAARRQLAELKQFVRQRQLVTIPGSAEVRVESAPPFMRYNQAAIYTPGPLDRHLPAYYWIAPPNPDWSPAERQEYVMAESSLLFTSVHEVWPGHFLQFQHTNRLDSKLGQLLFSYCFIEGWAHYTEEMMWEVGLGDGDPATHVGQLLGALERDVRYLCAIGLHTKGMTVAQAQKMFREAAFLDPASARQQAARGTFDPGYLNYTLGKLMIRKLRADWTASRGGRAAWREFHDRLLSRGAAPVPLIRRAMLGVEAGPPL